MLSRRHLPVLALLSLAGTATLIGVHNAFARWRPASARSVGSAKVQITSNRITGLKPGQQWVVQEIDPLGEAMDRSIPFGRGAGEELEHVLHLRHDFECHIHP